MGGRNGHTHLGGPQDPVAEPISRLHLSDDGSFGKLARFHAFEGVMQVRIEFLPRGIFHPYDAVLNQQIGELPINHLEAAPVILIGRVLMGSKRPLEIVEHRQQGFSKPHDGPLPILAPLPIDPLAEILEIRLPADERLPQLVPLGLELGQPLGLWARPRLLGQHATRSYGLRGFAFRPFLLIDFRLFGRVMRILVMAQGALSPLKVELTHSAT